MLGLRSRFGVTARLLRLLLEEMLHSCDTATFAPPKDWSAIPDIQETFVELARDVPRVDSGDGKQAAVAIGNTSPSEMQ
jgi:hypothetical protein